MLYRKHKPEDYRIYKALANMTMKLFIKDFVESDKRNVYIVGVDDIITTGTKVTHSSASQCTFVLTLEDVAES